MQLTLMIVRLVVSALLIVGGVMLVGEGATLFALPLLAVSGILLYPLIADPLGSALAKLVYSGQAGEVPEQFSQVQALVSQGQPESALAELDRLLAERPDLIPAQVYKVRLLYEQLQRPAEASRLAWELLLRQPWRAEFESVAMIAVDAELERGQPREAARLLQQLLPRVDNPSQRQVLAQRLGHLPS